MANKTFGDLPARSKILADDFFITNRTSDVNFPEGRTGIDTLKNYLYPGLIIKNTKLVGSKEFEAKISSQSMTVQNGTNLVTFKDYKKSVHGLFQIKATQSKGTGINICLYSLTYVPNDKKFTQTQFYFNELLEVSNSTNTVTITPQPQHLFIDPFIPNGTGSFKIDIGFLETDTAKKCKIEASILLFETF